MTSHSDLLKLLTPDEREAYEERAAIMEFDGGLTREAAEAQAFAIVRRSGRSENGGRSAIRQR